MGKRVVLKQNEVGIIGATSFVGECLLKLLVQSNIRVTAYSRHEVSQVSKGVNWRLLSAANSKSGETLNYWISLVPIWVLHDYFPFLEAYGVRRLVVLSSTSRFTKIDSSDPGEQENAHQLIDAEAKLQSWAESHGIEWVVLRPTLIYGLGRDTNISEIARFIRRFGFFPLLGKASGLRQPIHVQDVACACLAALQEEIASHRAYNISGGETLTYRDMVIRIFTAMQRRPHLFPVPLSAFRVAVRLLRYLPRYRLWTVAMAERMNQDLVFDHNEAERDLSFKPRAFVLTNDDVSG